MNAASTRHAIAMSAKAGIVNVMTTTATAPRTSAAPTATATLFIGVDIVADYLTILVDGIRERDSPRTGRSILSIVPSTSIKRGGSACDTAEQGRSQPTRVSAPLGPRLDGPVWGPPSLTVTHTLLSALVFCAADSLFAPPGCEWSGAICRHHRSHKALNNRPPVRAPHTARFNAAASRPSLLRSRFSHVEPDTAGNCSARVARRHSPSTQPLYRSTERLIRLTRYGRSENVSRIPSTGIPVRYPECINRQPT